MQNDRSTAINVGGEDYELLLTTRATKEIAQKCGGIENLGEALSQSKDITEALDLTLWLIVLLANQSIQIHNLKNKDDKKPLLTQEELELLTVPSDLMTFKNAVLEAVQKGTARFVKSEEDEKNAAAE